MVYRKDMEKDGAVKAVYPSRRAAADAMSVDTHVAFEVVTQCRFVAEQVKEYLESGRLGDRGEKVELLLTDLGNLETAIGALVSELEPIDQAYLAAMDEEDEIIA